MRHLSLALVWVGGFLIGYQVALAVNKPEPVPVSKERWGVGLCVDLIPAKPWEPYHPKPCVIKL